MLVGWIKKTVQISEYFPKPTPLLGKCGNGIRFI